MSYSPQSQNNLSNLIQELLSSYTTSKLAISNMTMEQPIEVVSYGTNFSMVEIQDQNVSPTALGTINTDIPQVENVVPVQQRQRQEVVIGSPIGSTRRRY